MNGMDVTPRPSGKWIVACVWEMKESDAPLYEKPIRHIRAHVRPMRQRTRREAYRDYWWRHVEQRPGMWKALAGLPRYIATPTVSKHPLFVWLDAGVCPNHQLIVIARADDTTFGIITVDFTKHGRSGSGMAPKRKRPQIYANHHVREFPFPKGYRPDVPAAHYALNPHAFSIAEATRRLVQLRER